MYPLDCILAHDPARPCPPVERLWPSDDDDGEDDDDDDGDDDDGDGEEDDDDYQ